MNRWVKRIAVVTGASSGIGASIAKRLAVEGLEVVGISRRKNIVDDMAMSLPVCAKGNLYALKCDVTDESDVIGAIQWVEKTLGGGVSILINNAGVLRHAYFGGQEPTQGWRDVLNTNVLGTALCTRYALHSMERYNILDGHFININSTTGHHLANLGYGNNMYAASKHAVRVLTEALRSELVRKDSSMRVTSISPGIVRTNLSDNSHADQEIIDYIKTTKFVLSPDDVTDTVVYALSAPANVNISQITVKHTNDKIL